MPNVLPRMREISLSADQLVRAMLSLGPDRRLSLLDSCGVQGGKLLIGGFDPFEVIEVRNGIASVHSRHCETIKEIKTDALNLLDERLARYKTASAFPTAVCIGTISYELGYQLERLRNRSNRDKSHIEPDAVFAFYDTIVVHDYESKRTTIVSVESEERFDEIEKWLGSTFEPMESGSSISSSAISNMSLDAYLAAVARIKEYIAAGDIYQANLTHQLTCEVAKDDSPEDIFLRLRHNHPAPFAAFIRRRDDTVISISPERFLRVSANDDSRTIEAWPIKGTRARGADMIDDDQLRSELQHSAKDRAENVMIVDLLRNDLGRVCNYGSVEVTELCSIEEHPTLFHLVSKVRGELRNNVTPGDLLRACFPCGSITGAPKIRAMEIIDEVETAPRGLSMGAIGYFGFDGSIDLNVAIRTMIICDGIARFNVGGGIVADSDPLEEYEESLTKARALLTALGATEPSISRSIGGV